MEQLIMSFSDSPKTIEEVYQSIVSCLSTYELPVDMLKLKPLMQSGVANVVVLEKTMCKIIIKQSGVHILCLGRLLNETTRGNLEYTPDKAMENYIRLPISTNQTVSSIGHILKAAFKSAFRENADTSFGCCSRFIECSDARKCTNPNPILALGCKYKDNLENGRVFYGKHPTI